jgi:hypothetical protein
VFGTVMGILTARYAMEVYVLKNASPYYTFDTTTPTLIVKPTVIVLAAGLLLSVAAIWFACTKLLRSTAIELMRPKVPGGRKRSGSGKRVLVRRAPEGVAAGETVDLRGGKDRG